jgi:uncharacterized repeat protein (TIGR01451 family)
MAMKRAYLSIFVVLILSSLICLRAWPAAGGDLRAATSAEAGLFGPAGGGDAALLDRFTPTNTNPPRHTPTPTNPRIPTDTPIPTATRPEDNTRTPTTTTPPRTRTPTPTTQPGCEYLSADFNWSVACATSFTFSDQSATSHSDPINSWDWDFGDGATSTLQNPTHSYGPGVYDVTLTVRTRSGCEASVSKQVPALSPEWVIRKELVSPVGQPVHVGDEVTYRLVIGAVPPNPILDYVFYDLFDTQYFELVSASPSPDSVKPACSSSMFVVWENQGPIAAGAEREYYVTLRVKAEIGPPVSGQKCNQAWALITFVPEDCRYSVYAEACVEAGPRPSGLTLTKTRLDPASGVAQIGDVVSYMIEIHNQGAVTVPDFDVVDTFLDAEYDFVFGSPAPSHNTTDGTTHSLIWDNMSLAPGGSFVILVELRAKVPGVLANCAQAVEWIQVNGVFTVRQPVPGPDSCASVRVEAPDGRHFTVWKRFTMPSNHVANLGDWVAFDTECKITGTEPAVRIDLFDHIAPASVSPFLPLNFGFLWAFQTGDWAKVTAAFKAQSIASPAVNTAEWTVTWPDGSKETKAAQDHVFIVDGDIGKGLFMDKWLGDPLPNAVISDTVTFHIAINNVTGVDLPVLPLDDTFPAQCLSFLGASIPPDQVLPGKLIWNNVGPLPLGDHILLDVQFHADAVCPAALNCASATYGLPGAAAQTGADCDVVPILGDQPRLVVTKQRTSPNPAQVGDLVTWNIVLQNVGTAPLAIVPLHDGYQSAYLEFQSAVPAPDNIDLVHGRLDWNNLGPLGPGQSATVNLTLLAKAPGVGVLNCAESGYTVGSSAFTPYQCATVDIIAQGPAVGVDKELAWPLPGKPLAVGDTAAFTITVRNAGPVALSNVVVEDHFDPGCLSFVPGGSMPPAIVGPGHLRWTFPSLAPGGTRSWQVLLHADQPCNPTHNCVVATADPPEGPPVLAEACVPLAIEEPRPGLRVRKAMVAPTHVPQVGEVIDYELVVRNAGNTTLMTVDVTDSYDPACLQYVAAIPSPDIVDTVAGHIHWNNVGPLAPGDAAILHVSLRAVGPCAFAPNCVEARWLVAGVPELVAHDCVEVPVRAAADRTPTPTATWPAGLPTLTPTATVRPGEPTPTATGGAGVLRLYLPVVKKRF